MDMTKSATGLDQLRDQILAKPEMILSDAGVMKALARANERQVGENVVDLRGVAMDRLEQRFDRLEDTHKSVIAAAYENIAGTQQIHRGILALLEPLDFTEFLQSLRDEISQILKIDSVRLCLESPVSNDKTQQALCREYGSVIGFYGPGSVDEYLTEGRNMTARAVTLRQVAKASDTLYGDKAPWIRSEALLKLDLGSGNLPGMLAMGSEDPHQFSPDQGTDLLAFFGDAFERIMRRWLE
ncbi:MAG: hypothetical protein ACI861_001281 [Paracoccaceae bacterium]|jgi:uncharacterized protein YigA (DUF484 family)